MGYRNKSLAPTAESQIAIILDFDNIEISYTEKYGQTAEVNWKKVSELAVPYGRVVFRRAYADWSENSTSQRELLRLGFQLINVPSRKRGKNAADIKIVIDALEEFIIKNSSVSHVMLVSGDGDFTDLVHYLRAHGMFVIGVGVLGSSAEYLINACDQYEYYDLIEKPEEVHAVEVSAPPLKDAGHDVSEARQLLRKVIDTQGGEWVSAGTVKNQMQRLKPDFNERNYGFGRFKDFLVAQEDIVEARTNKKGGHFEARLRQAGSDEQIASSFEAQVDKYLMILARNRISMAPTEHRPMIIRALYDLFKKFSGRSFLQIREEIHSHFEEKHPEIKQSIVHDAVHQVYITGCLNFEHNDKSAGGSLWQKKASLRWEIKSPQELLSKTDAHLIRTVEMETPPDEVDVKALARILYGNNGDSEVLHYLEKLRISPEQASLASKNRIAANQANSAN